MENRDHTSNKLLLLEIPFLENISKNILASYSNHNKNVNILLKTICIMIKLNNYLEYYDEDNISGLLIEKGIEKFLEVIFHELYPKYMLK